MEMMSPSLDADGMLMATNKKPEGILDSMDSNSADGRKTDVYRSDMDPEPTKALHHEDCRAHLHRQTDHLSL